MKIFFLIIFVGYFTNTRAQVLSTVDKTIVNDIENFIQIIATSPTDDFENLINYGAGLIAKDTNVLLYEGYPTKTLHADRYSIFNYFADSVYLYNCLYENKNNVLLVIKAMDRLLNNGKGNWKISLQKSIEDDENVPYLIYKNKKIAFFQKKSDNTLLRLSFISFVNNNELSIDNTNNNKDTFLKKINNEFYDINNNTLKTDSNKVKEIQITLMDIVTKGKQWFEKNIANRTTNDTTAFYYDATPVNKMYAQQYYGKKNLGDSAMFYVCTYTTLRGIAAATNAIDALSALKNSEWILLKSLDKNGDINQKLYLNGIYIGYTVHFKKENRFEILIKKVD